MYDFEEIREDYESEHGVDEFFSSAYAEIRAIYVENPKAVFFLRQLQVRLEKKYFHWITYNAIKYMLKEGFLSEIKESPRKGLVLSFIVHHTNRYPRREINKITEIVLEYSQDHITRSCGHRAEDLFYKAFAKRGFMPVAEKVKEFNDKKWEKSGHDLDYVFQKDGKSYGCEIKNTLGYIDSEELDIKLEMCNHFGVKPVFVMRYAPKTYIKKIYDYGGFSLIFETQIYELSQEELVEKMKKIGLPVICSKAIPDGIIARFEKWHALFM